MNLLWNVSQFISIDHLNEYMRFEIQFNDQLRILKYLYHIYTGILHDKEEEGIGKSLFTHANGQSSNTFYDDKWRPEWLNEAGDDKTNMMAEIPDNV